MQFTHLTPAEEHLMKLLWQLDSFYMKDIMEQHPEPKPHQNTVSTYLKILTEKNFLGTEKEGRIYRYTVKIPYKDYQKFLTRNLIHEHFEDDRHKFLKFLVDEKIISPEDSEGYFAAKTTIVPLEEKKQEENRFSDFINEITSVKKSGKEKKKEKKKKKKK
ncbi:BlaI/MecI/CopY family transcriptional regulator [Daejeonia sp. YH14]|uniref:BlaI/MecI/CopY family transcriptional regulator n=1 Tax=Daejeonia sp. YH14 TaxID=3439042 RepID=UPI003F497235